MSSFGKPAYERMCDIKGIDPRWDDITREDRMAWEGAADAAIMAERKTRMKSIPTAAQMEAKKED
jgi:hypothetical protein